MAMMPIGLVFKAHLITLNCLMTAPLDPLKPHSVKGSLYDLADALNTLRDSLLDASIALQDYQFELDSEQRSYANKVASAVIDRVTAGLR